MRTPQLCSAALVLACSPSPTTSSEPGHEDATQDPGSQPRRARGDEPQMRFFVASIGIDGSADLGGLPGADDHCQALAAAAGAGGLTWRAYLSTADRSENRGVDARDRIGEGPWYNANHELIARDLESLHSEANGLSRRTALTEHGEIPPKTHDILTGSDAAGRLARTHGQPATCSNWTSKGDGVARIGHSDRMDSESFANPRFKRWYGSWNSEHDTLGCGADHLAQSGGGGAFYCFAADDFPPLAETSDGAPSQTPSASYRRGVNLHERLSDAAFAQGPLLDRDMKRIASRGFDHVRLVVAGHAWVGEHGDLKEDVVSAFDETLKQAQAAGLGVVLAMHSTPGYRDGTPSTSARSVFTDEATRGDAAYLWWLVARRYATVGAGLRFEVLDRPVAPDAERMQAFNREVLHAVRRISSDRIVYLTSHDPSIDSAEEVDLSDPNTRPVVRVSKHRGIRH